MANLQPENSRLERHTHITVEGGEVRVQRELRCVGKCEIYIGNSSTGVTRLGDATEFFLWHEPEVYKTRG